MSALEKTISLKMETYLRDVRAILESNGVEKEEIVDLLDNLRCHALETASRHMGSMSLDDAVSRTVASLEVPETYASYTSQSPSPEKKTAEEQPGWLGKISALTMILALLLAVTLSDQKLFDTPRSGLVFVFGEMLALGTGIATWPNVWAKVGTLCSALLLMFLVTVFLWVTISKTV